jgi:hypothetical protein
LLRILHLLTGSSCRILGKRAGRGAQGEEVARSGFSGERLADPTEGAAMAESDDDGSTGALACMVLDLCEDAKDRLTKEVFIRLAQATARILLVASASEKTLVDVNDADDGVAAENAEIIRDIWRSGHA